MERPTESTTKPRPRPSERPPSSAVTRPPPPRGRAWPWLVLLGLVVAALVAAALNGEPKPDPHYLLASRLVEDYERNKPLEDRNYGHPAYQQAMKELGLVDPKSPSAKPARDLAQRITADSEAFRERRAAAAEKIEQARHQRRINQQAVFAAQHRAAQNPRVKYEECEEHGGGHAHKH